MEGEESTKELSDLLEDEDKPKEEGKVEDLNTIKPDETIVPIIKEPNAVEDDPAMLGSD